MKSDREPKVRFVAAADADVLRGPLESCPSLMRGEDFAVHLAIRFRILTPSPIFIFLF